MMATTRRQPERNSRNFSRVMTRDRGLCRYCGDEANSVDHIDPVSYYPDNSIGNLVAACMPCNLTAGAKVFPSFEAKRDWVLERRRINDRAEQLAIEAAHDARPLVVDGPGELLVKDAIWGDPEEPDYVPLPAEILAAEAASGDGLCGCLTAKGRPCQLLAEECQFHGVPAEAEGSGREPPETLEETQRADRRRKEIRAHRLTQQRAAQEALLRKARGEGTFPWTSVSP